MILERTEMVEDRGARPISEAPFNQIKTQRSGFDLERRGSGTDELSAKPEAKDVELAPTRSS